MGEKAKEALKLKFDKRLRLEFHGAKMTSDGGLLARRELDGVLELTEIAPTYLRDTRGGRNVQHEIVPLLRQSVYSRLAGYEDTNHTARLARDPAIQAVIGRRALEKQAASTNTLSRFETEVLVTGQNRKGLEQLNEVRVDRAMTQTRHQRVILDMDSSESPVYVEQEGAAYNGHFQSVFTIHSSCLTTSETAREPCCGRGTSTVPTAGRKSCRQRWNVTSARGLRLLFRGDAAFAKPEMHEYLELHGSPATGSLPTRCGFSYSS